MKSPNVEDKLVYCDLCCLTPRGERVWQPTAGVARWDAPTKEGPWAYVCERHRDSAWVSDSRELKQWKALKGK